MLLDFSSLSHCKQVVWDVFLRASDPTECFIIQKLKIQPINEFPKRRRDGQTEGVGAVIPTLPSIFFIYFSAPKYLVLDLRILTAKCSVGWLEKYSLIGGLKKSSRQKGARLRPTQPEKNFERNGEPKNGD